MSYWEGSNYKFNKDKKKDEYPEKDEFLKKAPELKNMAENTLLKAALKPNPHKLYVVEYAGFFSIQNGHKYGDLDVLDVDHVGYKSAKNYAERIVSCVNALAGIENPAEFVAQSKANEARIRELEAQLKKAVDWLERIESYVYSARPEEDRLISSIYSAVLEATNDMKSKLPPAPKKKGEHHE